MDLLKLSACTENSFGNSISSSLEHTSSGLGNAVKVIELDATSAENVSISEVLSGKVTNRQSAENNLSSSCNNLFQFVIDNLPLGVNNFLEVLWVLHAYFSIVFFGFKLKFDVEEQNFRVSEILWLLFKASIREGLLEADTFNQE